MPDHSQMKLGKKPARHDSRTLEMGTYLTPELPVAPSSIDYSKGITDWGVMLNDRLACCTIAAIGHAIQTWTVNAGSRNDFSDDAVRLYYEKWDGYDPKNPASDQGGVELDVLNSWRNDPLGFAGRKLDAYVSIHLSDSLSLLRTDMMDAIWLFGGAYIGVELPRTAQTQEVWDTATGPEAEAGSWGGHAIFVNAYDLDTLTCITWGQSKKMTWAWFQTYCEEAYALVSKDWLNAQGVSPSGLNLEQLETDLKSISQ